MKFKKSIILLGLLLTSTFILANQITLTKVTSTEYVDVVVLLKPGVEVNFPNLIVTHQYSALNGFSARIPAV
ncbi:MAG: hypothetical protein DRO63_07375, partial [Candidatus Gerdarchaeota archaeon]